MNKISILLILSISSFGQNLKNLEYAQTEQKKLLLDLYLPENTQNPILIVWVHGGAWHSGSKENPPMELVKLGYALASIDYRLSTEAVFPAMIHDIKAAVRFLRRNAEKYHFNKDKIILWGSSAGGHLVALAGLSNGDSYLEGTLGDYKAESSDVNLVIDFFGPSNFQTILYQSTPHGISVRAPALALFFGKPFDPASEETKLASPVFYVDKNDPPVFIAHGNQDNQVPINQSLELFAKLKNANISTKMEVIQEQGHGGPMFSEQNFMTKVDQFIKKNLK